MDKLKEIFESLNFAAYKHRFQKRKGLKPIPYINHPIGVAKHLIEHLHDPSIDILQAAILHDTLEDTNTTFEELKQNFGHMVAEIVKELTDDMSLPYAKRKQVQVEKANYLSYEAGCIKIADKHCNINDVLYSRIGWMRQRKIQYIKWAQQVVGEISNKNPELEKSFNEIVAHAGEVLNTDFSR